MFSLLYTFCLHFYFVNIHILDYSDSRLSGLFTEVPTSPDNRGSTVVHRIINLMVIFCFLLVITKISNWFSLVGYVSFGAVYYEKLSQPESSVKQEKGNIKKTAHLANDSPRYDPLTQKQKKQKSSKTKAPLRLSQ